MCAGLEIITAVKEIRRLLKKPHSTGNNGESAIVCRAKEYRNVVTYKEEAQKDVFF